MRRAFICGLSGLDLTSEEARFLRASTPAGIIIFARNIETPERLRRLVSDARTASGATDHFLVLVDQEGGRVQRLSAPHWRRYPAAATFLKACAGNAIKSMETASLCTRLLARDLVDVGINVSCAPVLDVPVPGAHNVIGDRAYACDPETVAALGGAVAKALMAGGVLPVMKHIPGHGRAMADSHYALPVVDTPLDVLERTDFLPFQRLRHLPMAMTAHVIFSAVDDHAVTVSSRAIDRIIRGFIGFDGLLMSDDLSMKALSGSFEGRTRAAFEAGCDVVLHCNGDMTEMQAIAGATPMLDGDGLRRMMLAFEAVREPQPLDIAAAEAALAEMSLLS